MVQPVRNSVQGKYGALDMVQPVGNSVQANMGRWTWFNRLGIRFKANMRRRVSAGWEFGSRGIMG
jgi:hypothetical protein